MGWDRGRSLRTPIFDGRGMMGGAKEGWGESWRGWEGWWRDLAAHPFPFRPRRGIPHPFRRYGVIPIPSMDHGMGGGKGGGKGMGWPISPASPIFDGGGGNGEFGMDGHHALNKEQVSILNSQHNLAESRMMGNYHVRFGGQFI